MSTPAKVITAYEAWEALENSDTPSPHEVIEALDELTRCCRNVDETEAIVTAVERLRHAYQEWNGDMDGTYVMALVAAYGNWRL